MNAKGLTVIYGDRFILQNLCFEAIEGQVNLIIGQNGSGKSTLLRVLAGVASPNSGTIFYKGKDISNFSRYQRLKMGIVYIKQKDNVYPNLSVLENLKVAFNSGRKEKKEKEIIEQISEYFPLLKECLFQKAGLMSGGEKQQLAISMGILQEPKVLLIDEPSSGLFPSVVEEIMSVISEISRSNKMTVIVTEQNIKSASRISSKVNLLISGVLEQVEIDSMDGEKIYQIYTKMIKQ